MQDFLWNRECVELNHKRANDSYYRTHNMNRDGSIKNEKNII